MRGLWNSFYALIILVMLIWAATASIAAYLFQQDFRAEEVAFFDILLAFLTLLAITLAMPERRRSLRRYGLRHVPALVACSLLGIFVYNYLLYRAYTSNASDVTPYAIINYMWPLTTILFGVVILKERLTVYTIIGAVMGFLGFGLIQAAKVFERPAVADAWRSEGPAAVLREVASTLFAGTEATGCLLALTGAIMWGLFGPLARRWTDRYRWDPLSSMMLLTGIGTALGLVFLAPHVRWGRVLARWDFLVLVVWLGAISHGVANVMWLRVIQVGGAGRTGVVAYLTPVVALAYLGVFHRQFPSWSSAFGLALIIGAIALAETHRRRGAAARPTAIEG